MRFLPLVFFIAVPLAEIAVFIKVGELIGIGWTVLLVVVTAVLGVALLKRQGLAVLARAQQAMDAGRLPVDSVIDGVCLLVAGAFLLTPGLITDTIGFLLMVPGFRRALAHWVVAKLRQHGSVHVEAFRSGPTRRPEGEAPMIDGEFVHVDDEAERPEPAPPEGDRPKRDRRSPWSG